MQDEGSIDDLISGGGDLQQELMMRAERQRRLQRIPSSLILNQASAAPSAPQIFSAATAGIESIQFDWTVVNDPLVTAYNVYSSPDNNAGSASRIGVVYQNPALTGSMHYVDFPGSLVTRYYWVSAVNQQGQESARTAMQLGTAPTTSGIPNTIPFSDATPLVKNAFDGTKQAIFSAALISTGTTRTYTLPDADVTLAGINLAQTWTAVQTHSASVVMGANLLAVSDATWNLGSTTAAFANIYGQTIWIGDGSAVNRWKWYKTATNVFALADQLGAQIMAITGTAATASMVLAGHFYPPSPNTRNIGTGGLEWASLYVYRVQLVPTTAPTAASGLVYFKTSDTSFKGCPDGVNFYQFGFIDLGQTWTATQTMRTIVPATTDLYSLGTSSGSEWLKVWAQELEFQTNLKRVGSVVIDSSGNVSNVSSGTFSGAMQAASYKVGATTIIDGSLNVINAAAGTFSGNVQAAGYKIGASTAATTGLIDSLQGYKKFDYGGTSLVAGTKTVTTALTTVQIALVCLSVGGAPTEYLEASGYSGSQFVIHSSAGASTAAVNWIAFGT